MGAERRILVIEKCADCPHFSRSDYFLDHKWLLGPFCKADGVYYQQLDPNAKFSWGPREPKQIPDWCPLPKDLEGRL